MNTAAISLLADAGFQGREAEILLRRLLSDLVTPTGDARKALQDLGLKSRDLDPSLRSIPEIVRCLADSGLDEAQAKLLFGAAGAPAILALILRVERLEELQSS